MKAPLAAYKEFIDAAVSVKKAATAQWVIKGAFPDVQANQQRNTILASLTQAQRDELALIVQEAKESGVHDLLALLNDTAELEYLGTKLPKEPFGTELHFDFVARSAGDSWPE